MSKAQELKAQMTLPVIAAPMFIVSDVELVTAVCQAGMIGTFPALNGRTSEAFEEKVVAVSSRLADYKQQHPDTPVAPFGVNLILHKSNPRQVEDLELCVKHKVPVIITSLGKPDYVIEAVHGYGGIVLSDVTTLEFAHKVAKAGVDGIVLVCAGAGGHAGRLNPLMFVPAVRSFFDGILAVSGVISTGEAIRAVEVLGADFAYMGTRFLATEECAAPPSYKDMILASTSSDVINTAAVTGVPANFLRASLEENGYEIASSGEGNAVLGKAWKQVWSAGQGVEIIQDVVPVQALAQRLTEEYQRAKSR